MSSRSSFYGNDINNFSNTIYAVDQAIIKHYGDMIFKSEYDRIIYASNKYCFRKRKAEQKGKTTGDALGLDLPFMNFKLKDISPSTDRFLFNHIANIEGLFEPDLKAKIRLVPVQAQYEALAWFTRYEDILFANYLLEFDDSNETILYPEIPVLGQNYPIPGFLGYNLNLDLQFEEEDWLVQNKIQAMTMDISLDTFLILVDQDISITETTELDFGVVSGDFSSYRFDDDLGVVKEDC